MDANELKGQPRVPLQRAVDWILSECGSKIWDDRSVYVEEDDGDGWKSQYYCKEYSAAALRAVNELLGKLQGGQLKARGYRGGDTTRGREEIPADDFPDTATDCLYGETPLESLLPKEGYGEKKRSHLQFEDSAQIRYFLTVYWSGIVVSGDDVLALWPEAKPAREAAGAKPLARKETKPEMIAAWLKEQYPTRPGFNNKELAEIVRRDAPHIGNFESRTFDKAISIAYP